MSEVKIQYDVELDRQTGNGWERLSSHDDIDKAKQDLKNETHKGEQLNKTGYWHYIYQLVKITTTRKVIK